MIKEKLVYLINDKEYKVRDFYDKLQWMMTPLEYCCFYESDYYEKEFRRAKSDLLYGFTKTINGVRFKINRVKMEV